MIGANQNFALNEYTVDLCHKLLSDRPNNLLHLAPHILDRCVVNATATTLA